MTEKENGVVDERPKEKMRGPVVLRRERRDELTTTDQRLLDSRGPSDWVHTDPWRVLRIQAEFVEGFGALAEVPSAVTVFGSARTGRDHPEYQLGRDLGAALAQAGFAAITGSARATARTRTFAEWVVARTGRAALVAGFAGIAGAGTGTAAECTSEFALFSFPVGGFLGFVFIMDQPFRGETSIQPDAIVKSIERIDTRIQ